MCCLKNTHLNFKNNHSEEMEDDIPSKMSQKEVGIAILISDKTDFTPK